MRSSSFLLSAESGGSLEPSQPGFSRPSAFLEAACPQTPLPASNFSAGVCDKDGRASGAGTGHGHRWLCGSVLLRGHSSRVSLFYSEDTVAMRVCLTQRTQLAGWVCPTGRTRVAMCFSGSSIRALACTSGSVFFHWQHFPQLLPPVSCMSI